MQGHFRASLIKSFFLSFSNYCFALNQWFIIAAEEYWKKLNKTLAWNILKNLASVFPTFTMEISEKNLIETPHGRYQWYMVDVFKAGTSN